MQLLLHRSFLRPPRPEDAPSMARYANNRAIWRNLRDRFPHPYTLADAEAFIARHADEEPTRLFARLGWCRVMTSAGARWRSATGSQSRTGVVAS